MLKEEFERVKEFEGGDPWQQWIARPGRNPPAHRGQRRQPGVRASEPVAAGKTQGAEQSEELFIQPNERPRLAQVSSAKLAQVPIYPIPADMLARQVAMERG